jgi:hypothetical protein
MFSDSVKKRKKKRKEPHGHEERETITEYCTLVLCCIVCWSNGPGPRTCLEVENPGLSHFCLSRQVNRVQAGRHIASYRYYLEKCSCSYS